MYKRIASVFALTFALGISAGAAHAQEVVPGTDPAVTAQASAPA